MHEAGIMQSALDLACDLAREGRGHRVTKLVLTVGSLSSAVPESLRFAFDALSPATMAEGAFLDIHWVEAACRCTVCDKTFPFEGNGYICPTCGEASLNLLRGRELELTTVEWI